MKQAFIFLSFFLAVHFYTTETLEVSPLALPGEATRFYSPQNADNLEDTLVDCINKAESSITLFTYTLRSAKIIQALNDASRRTDMRVSVVYDHNASKDAEKKLCEKIHLTSRASCGLMHLKLLIIDGRHTWIGSANMTRESLKSQANLITHLDDETFARAVLLKAEQVTGPHFEKPILPQVLTTCGQTLELRFLPDDQEAIARIKDLIRSAKKSIRVAMFTFTREDLADTLIQASKRGVQVEVVTDLTQSRNTNKKIVTLLQKHNIPVALKDTGGLMHHKFMWIDDNILEHGSANWTKAAFKDNDDYIVIINPLTHEQQQVMNKIWNAFFTYFSSP